MVFNPGIWLPLVIMHLTTSAESLRLKSRHQKFIELVSQCVGSNSLHQQLYGQSVFSRQQVQMDYKLRPSSNLLLDKPLGKSNKKDDRRKERKHDSTLSSLSSIIITSSNHHRHRPESTSSALHLLVQNDRESTSSAASTITASDSKKETESERRRRKEKDREAKEKEKTSRSKSRNPEHAVNLLATIKAADGMTSTFSSEKRDSATKRKAEAPGTALTTYKIPKRAPNSTPSHDQSFGSVREAPTTRGDRDKKSSPTATISERSDVKDNTRFILPSGHAARLSSILITCDTAYKEFHNLLKEKENNEISVSCSTTITSIPPLPIPPSLQALPNTSSTSSMRVDGGNFELDFTVRPEFLMSYDPMHSDDPLLHPLHQEDQQRFDEIFETVLTETEQRHLEGASLVVEKEVIVETTTEEDYGSNGTGEGGGQVQYPFTRDVDRLLSPIMRHPDFPSPVSAVHFVLLILLVAISVTPVCLTNEFEFNNPSRRPESSNPAENDQENQQVRRRLQFGDLETSGNYEMQTDPAPIDTRVNFWKKMLKQLLDVSYATCCLIQMANGFAVLGSLYDGWDIAVMFNIFAFVEYTFSLYSLCIDFVRGNGHTQQKEFALKSISSILSRKTGGTVASVLMLSWSLCGVFFIPFLNKKVSRGVKWFSVFVFWLSCIFFFVFAYFEKKEERRSEERDSMA